MAEAVRLACEGMSERQIATRLGLHHSTVNEALHAEFERVRPSEAEIQAARERKRERLYRGLEKWMRVRDDSIAAHEANPAMFDPDYKAGELVLKHEALLANLEGTDAPKRAEVSGPDGGPLVGGVTPEAAAILVRQAFGDQASMAANGSDSEAEAQRDGGTGEVPERPSAE